MNNKLIQKIIAITAIAAMAVTIGTVNLQAITNSNNLTSITMPKKQSVTQSNATAKNTAGSLQTSGNTNGTQFSYEALPQKYSSVDLGYVSPMKNQGDISTCWAFSTTGALETSLLKKGISYNASEEHINHWATTRTDSNGEAYGCFRSYKDGWFSTMALGYLTSWVGARSGEDIPYRSADNQSYADIQNLGTADYGVNSAVFLSKDTNTVKQAVYQYGAVSASYNHNDTYFNTSGTAYCQTTPVTNGFEGHAILVVGWDDSYLKDNFNSEARPKNNGAWLVKNSWGSYNNLGGYFWISYEDYYLFSDTFASAYAIIDSQEINDNYKKYQAEEFGSTYQFSILNNESQYVDDITFINVFDFTKNYPFLDKVTFECESIGAEYYVYYIPVDTTGVPVDDKSQWQQLTTGITGYSGYISVDTGKYPVPVGKGGIGITINANSQSSTATDDIPCAIGCDEWITDYSGTYLFKPNTQKNVSYFSIDSIGMTELLDFYKELDDSIGSNFVIKAVTNPYEGDVNLDGTQSMLDILAMQNHITETAPLSSKRIPVGDLTGDGNISIRDVAKLQTILVQA